MHFLVLGHFCFGPRANTLTSRRRWTWCPSKSAGLRRIRYGILLKCSDSHFNVKSFRSLVLLLRLHEFRKNATIKAKVQWKIMSTISFTFPLIMVTCTTYLLSEFSTQNTMYINCIKGNANSGKSIINDLYECRKYNEWKSFEQLLL